MATGGRGRVEPNPMVGCVLVRDGTVIGTGIHERFGGPHAEPNAIADARNRGNDPAGATAYVTLEPCCHTDKKTPPCAPRLVEAGVSEVVIGCLDPNPRVNGKSVAFLRNSGLRVVIPDEIPADLHAEAKQLIAPFTLRTEHGRPYVTLKWAQSRDGFVAGAGGARRQISGPRASAAVHGLRSRCDAILVGVDTVICDDPILTARGVAESRLHTRMVLDTHLRTPATARLIATADEGAVVICHGENAAGEVAPDRLRELMKSAAILACVQTSPDGRVSIPALLTDVRMNDVTHLLVEPGPRLARSFFDSGAADRLWVFRSMKDLGEPNATRGPEVPKRYVETGRVMVGEDELAEYLDPETDGFFSTTPSADFRIVADEVGA